ncbi:MAG: NAD(+) synthase [Bacteroides sp.]|nr:NAD(+) synthase [Bacteroides sp.]MCM1550212.1 NAD(+) synthase [Clostridium sp.]
MKDGYIKVAAATPCIRVADCEYNRQQILTEIQKAANQGVKLLVLPELCMTGYTCGDLFLQSVLLEGALQGLLWVMKETEQLPIYVMLGLPVSVDCKLYNTAAFFGGGKLLGMIPKTCLPNYSEFYEARHFAKGNPEVRMLSIEGQTVPFGIRLLFRCRQLPEFILGCEICEDLWVPNPPSVEHTMAGATVICNPSASVEVTAKEGYRRQLVSAQAARTVSAYIYADAGEGESTTDVVFSAHNMISENGTMLAESRRFTNEMIVTEIDIHKLSAERRRMNTYEFNRAENYKIVDFDMALEETELTRTFARTPFIPANPAERTERCEEIFTLQAMGLKKRLLHTNSQGAVIGLSGGLDSTLALLVTARAFALAGLEHKNILGITMPGYGTTDRTYRNALAMGEALGITLREISIVKAVDQHFTDIGHDKRIHDITYENSQARERTQILMDMANQTNGLVIGTGDLSELALGWATYNGDHMSMYAVNASIPKTLVRHLVRYVADTCGSDSLRQVLLDVLDTPVSPELLPAEDGQIVQKTEDVVGPYELHDFFLYYMMRFGFSPAKIYRLARQAFRETYETEMILKWLKKFYWRFFSQQFKRSCVPDGPKVGTVALSPRGDWRMPSDASVSLWMQELECLKE